MSLCRVSSRLRAGENAWKNATTSTVTAATALTSSSLPSASISAASAIHRRSLTHSYLSSTIRNRTALACCGRRFFSAASAARTSSTSSSSPRELQGRPSSFTAAGTSGKPLFDKILIANRGEIACRIMRTCKLMGIKTVAIYSEPDKEAVHVKMADESYCVGPAASKLSYLNIDAIMNVIATSGAQAVHPGYGFLSENKDFQERLQGAGIKFIGPGTEAITAMGDKISSKLIAQKAKVNIIPGHLAPVKDEDEVVEVANKIGYPVMVKASGGGGGKGMRVAYNDAEARSGFQLSRAEAISSFNSDVMFVEKFIEEPRHIELQVLCDSHGNAVYLNERECSVQRRNQKVIEEAPSVFLDEKTRRAMGEQAVALAKAVGYESAGTVEFLVSGRTSSPSSSPSFYFLEMNTRLQVEHPVSEIITQIDIVEQMIRIAAGEKLSFKQSDIGIHGWALESRVYAEDPLKGFLPSIGTLKRYVEPTGEGVRVDSGVREGSEISIHYDPMISKLITYGRDRTEALARMRKALDSYVIRGLNHNVNFLRSLCDHPRFIEGRLSTKFIPEEYPQGYKGATLGEKGVRALVASAALVETSKLIQQANITDSRKLSSFDPVAHVKREMQNVRVVLSATQQAFIVSVVDTPQADAQGTTTVRMEIAQANSGGEGTPTAAAGTKHTITVSSTYKRGSTVFETQIDGGEKHTLQSVTAADGASKLTLSLAGTFFDLELQRPRHAELLKYMPLKEVVDTSKLIVSPMPGAVFAIKVKVGDEVAPGQEVAVVEAMKMQNALRASNPGKVKAILVKQGQTVAADQTLIEFA